MSDESDAEALAHALRSFGEAWADGDGARLAALLSPTYTHTDAYGTLLGRDAWLAYAGGRTGRDTRIAFRDVAVRRFGDIAIVTGFNDISGGGIQNPEDRADLTIAFTQVWRREEGRWLREAFQATPVQGAAFA